MEILSSNLLNRNLKNKTDFLTSYYVYINQNKSGDALLNEFSEPLCLTNFLIEKRFYILK